MKPFLVTLLSLITNLTWSQLPEPTTEQMSKLNFLIGEWDYTVTTLNKKGEVINERSYIMTFEAEFDQMLVRANSGYIQEDGSFKLGQRKWYFYDRSAKEYVETNFDRVGNFETYRGNFKNGEFILQWPKPKDGGDGVLRVWRKTMTEITNESFTWIWHYSEDEGKTWTKQWHSVFVRKSS